MNWRRGLLFAGIHLVVAVGMFAWSEASYWQLFRDANSSPAATRRLVVWQEFQTTDFNPCMPGGFIDGPPSPMELIVGVQMAPLGFWFGHVPCKSLSPVDRIIESRFGVRTKRTEIAVGIVDCLAVTALWLLVGGYPLTLRWPWWLEPGTFITICVCLTSNMVLIAAALERMRYPGSGVFPEFLRGLCWIAVWAGFFMWLVWFGLLVWRVARGGWRMVRLRVRVA